MQTPMYYFYGWKDSSLSKLSIDLSYGEELTCYEESDPLVCFNRQASSVGLKWHHHFLDHVIFIYILNQLAMTKNWQPEF